MKTSKLALALSAVPAAALACCGVGMSGRPVRFRDQTNIILWDAKSHIEHFVRMASFDTKSKDFGFIAPTPTKPTIVAVSKDAFDELAILQPHHNGDAAAGTTAAGTAGGFGSASVAVVQEKDVAGYHATTLLASDSKALAKWMRRNGYVTTPSVEQWTRFYIKKHWYLTAFKVKNLDQLGESMGVVRLSFKSGLPFNPFYVPKSNLGGESSLRVYFISKDSYIPKLGRQDWSQPSWTTSLPEETSAKLAVNLKVDKRAVPPGANLETFDDPTFPEPSKDDIFFKPAPASAATPKTAGDQPKSGSTGRALMVIGLFAVVGFLGWFFFPRKKKARPSRD